MTIDADHLPEGAEKVAAVRSMFDSIAPRYDLVNRLMTFRMDVGWRRRTVAGLGLPPRSVVADIACGTGDLVAELQRRGHRPIGFDLSFGMLAAAPRPFPRAQADALCLPLADRSIDGVTCGFALRNLVALPPFFAELARVVRPGGRIALLEVAEPPNPILRFGHGIYFGKVVPVVGGLLSDRSAYQYLPRSVAYLPDPPQLLDELRAAGFADANRHLFSVGISQMLSATPRPVKATTTRVDAEPDSGETPASTWFLSERRELRGWGEAAVIDVPAPWVDHVATVTAQLTAIAAADDVGLPGCGPVAFGALPYDRMAPARFVVPTVVLGRSAEGTHWRTVIEGGSDGGRPSRVDRPPTGQDRPPSMSITAECSDEDWMASVRNATNAIAAGDLTKVVLARRITVRADRAFDPAEIGRRLAAVHPSAFRFAVDGFVGASPELLVSRIGDVVRARPMAGTTPRSGDPRLDARRAAELLASAKNRAEHQITIDMVHDTLLPWCSYLDAEPEPQVAEAGSVQHLATMVEGRLSHPAPSVLALVATLHPTPAVGGRPRDAALRLIDELEPGGRGRYAGPVGWVDATGNGAFAVGIRSAEIVGDTATIFAGVGVVADSDPQSELDETRAKLAATVPSVIQI